MGAFKNIGISEYIKRYGFINGILRGAFLTTPLHLVRDYENKKILYYYLAKKYLEKHYVRYATTSVEGLKFGTCAYENPIWVYWKQGIDNAPNLVKRCVKSIKKYSSKSVITLDSTNIDNYVRLPEDIISKHQRGYMSDAAMSDLIRFSLLEHFGGTWIDATVLLTGEIPSYITESDFFAYRDTFGLIWNPAAISNWLIHSKPHNILIQETQRMAFAYWRNEKYVVDYLFTYMLLQIAYERNTDNCGWFPYANSDYCHQYLFALDEKYSEKLLAHIKEMSSIHKLTYKLHDSVLSNRDNVYAMLIGEEL